MPPLIYFLAAVLVAFSFNWLALIPWRRRASAHWTERARILYPVRVSAATNLVLVPINCVLAGWVLFPETKYSWWMPALSGWLGAVLGTYPINREIYPWLGFRKWLRQTLVASFLRSFGWLIFIGAIYLMPEEFGGETLAIGAAYILIQLWLIWGLRLWLAKFLGMVKPPSQRLSEIVSGISARMNIPVRHVWLLESSASNAVAYPTTRELVFSERLMELHPDDELTAICAHELSHLNEPRSVLIGRVIGSFQIFPFIFIKPLMHNFDFGGLVFPLVGWSLLNLFTHRLARRMEVRADQVATEHQSESGTYARALERLYRENQMPAVMPAKKRKPHPHLYDRLLAAGITPEYPRPASPNPVVLFSYLFWVLLGCLFWSMLKGSWHPR